MSEPKKKSSVQPMPEPSQMAQDAIHEHVHTGGSTFDPRSGRNMSGTRHVAVGVAREHSVMQLHQPTPAEYDHFAASHSHVLSRHSNSAIGTHYDPESGIHHIELVALTPSKAAGLAMAEHLGEKHVHNLATDEKIPTGASDLWQPSHMTVSERFDHLRSRTPKKEPYSGTHFSDKKLDKIEGSRRGETLPGKTPATNADAHRVHLGTKTGQGPDAPGGFYTVKAGSPAPSLVAAKPHSYQVRGHFAFGSTESPEFKEAYATGAHHAAQSGADAQTAHHLGLNAAEKALEDLGYDGYHSPAHPNVRFHFGDHSIAPIADAAGRR